MIKRLLFLHFFWLDSRPPSNSLISRPSLSQTPFITPLRSRRLSPVTQRTKVGDTHTHRAAGSHTHIFTQVTPHVQRGTHTARLPYNWRHFLSLCIRSLSYCGFPRGLSVWVFLNHLKALAGEETTKAACRRSVTT